MKISQPLSLYLDALRIGAALAVFVGHAGGYLMPNMSALIVSHADEGVAIFFVLSGFVIGMVTDGKERSLREYLFARVLRMYSVVPVALLATFLVDLLGYWLNENAYRALPWLSSPGYYDEPVEIVGSLLRALTFSNEFWGKSSTFGSNHAYWSLGFEVPYYVAFGIGFFCRGMTRFFAFATWLICVGPQIALFFVLWLAGVLCYYLVRDLNPLPRWGEWAMALAIVPVYGIAKLGFSDYKQPIYDPNAVIPSLLSFAYFLVIGSAVCLNILGVAALVRNKSPVPSWAANAVRWIAGGTFTLYLMHQPLMMLGRSILVISDGGVWSRICITTLVLVLCYLLAELGERRKRDIQRVIRGFRSR